ncbi:MAG: radical SAM protein [Acidobacteriota bacterium]
MMPSTFNLRVPLDTGDVFLMNALSGAQLVVSSEAADLLDQHARACPDPATRSEEELDALATFAQYGLLVDSREAEQQALASHFRAFREDTSQLRVTILTTLQCNFACRYCYQGSQNDPPRAAAAMSATTAAAVARWIEAQLDQVKPRRLVLTFFGGEPLLNVPAMLSLADACWQASRTRGVQQLINIITNGLLLTPAIVERMKPFGLNGVKVTLDGDRATHDRMRPTRGGQGSFDRIIANIGRVADQTRVAVGGNFDTATAGAFPALLDLLARQPFAKRISRVTFKPVIHSRAARAPASHDAPGSTTVRPGRFGTSCTSAAGAGGGAVDASSEGPDVIDRHMSRLREEISRRGFATSDGLHMGPCELYRRHSHTVGPDGTLYPCPGFAGTDGLSIGNIFAPPDGAASCVGSHFERLAPWRRCGDCSLVPVCGGGCAVASHEELGDTQAPSCHKRAFESALMSLAEQAAGQTKGEVK